MTDDRTTSPADGCVVGILLGVICWAVIIAVVLLVWSP